jgi:hypothetical protein
MIVRELIGKITLEEIINPLDENKIPNTFVIHVPNPLATYYTRFSEINRPNSILFITKSSGSFEEILRITKRINGLLDMKLKAAKCEMKIGSRKYNGIRIKGINRYSHIRNIQEAYKNEGFDFARNVRLKSETEALVRVNKFFNLKHISERIYQSPYNNDRFYVVIPKQMTWDEFREMTFKIKNNISITNFDIVKGIFYENDGITDMLRIIKPNITLEMVKKIEQKYLEEILQD